MLMFEPDYRYSTVLRSDIILKKISKRPPKMFASGIIGTVYDDNKIKLYYIPTFRNSWGSVFNGTVLQGSNRSYIVGSFHLPLFTSITMLIWWSIPAMNIMKAVIIDSVPPSHVLSIIDPSTAIILFISFFIQIVGIIIGKFHEKQIISFLETELLARYMPTADERL